MKPFLIALLIVAAVVFVVWLGLRLKPAPFASNAPGAEPETIPLPEGLPAPVERYYRQMYGDRIPVITSAVISGRGTMAPFGVPLPMRFRFVYAPGGEYHSTIQATFFRLPVINAVETMSGGHARGEMPYGIDEGAWFDQALNVRIWSEILTWFPAALLTDERVQWQAAGDDIALLGVPFGEKTEWIVLRFNPEDGSIQYFEAMKHRTATEKLMWINGIWADQGKEWIRLNIEEKVFNLDLTEDF